MSRLSYPKSECKEIGCQSKNSEGGRVEDRPVGRQAEGDVAELENLVEGKGKREEGRPDKRQRKAERGRHDEQDVRG